MTGRRASLIWLAFLSAGIGVFAGIWLMPHLRREVTYSETMDRLEAERSRLAAQVDELRAEVGRLRAAAGEEKDTGTEEPTSAADARVKAEATRSLHYVRLLAEAQEKLSQATSTIEALDGKAAELEASVGHLTEENRKLAASTEELEDRLARANRVVEAMQTQLKDGSERMVNLEVRNRVLRQEQRDAEDKLTRSRKMIAELEDLNRRREDLLTNIVRRYREVADTYRTVSLPQENTEQFGPATGVDLARIQHALSLAEEDLRQLRSMNARAERLEKELAEQ